MMMMMMIVTAGLGVPSTTLFDVWFYFSLL